MNNILYFSEWKLNEENIKNEIEIASNKTNDEENKKNAEETNIIKINGNTYSVKGNTVTDKEGNPLKSEKEEKYVKKLSDSADDAIHTDKAYTLYRFSGGVKKVKDDIKKSVDLDYFISPKSDLSMDDIVKDITAVGAYKYVSFDSIFKKGEEIDTDKINKLFGIHESGFGRGESLLPALFGDVVRKDPSDVGKDAKGDDAMIKNVDNENDGKNSGKEKKEDNKSQIKTDIEVKSAGTPMKVSVPNEIPKENGPEYVCAYSIARYIAGRNLGDIYLVIFNNDLEKKIIEPEETEKLPVTDAQIEKQDDEKTDISNKLGQDQATGFFIMNCGESVNPTSGGFDDKVKALANKLLGLIEIKELNNNRKDLNNFIFGYTNKEGGEGKILCFVNKGYKDDNGKNISFKEKYSNIK